MTRWNSRHLRTSPNFLPRATWLLRTPSSLHNKSIAFPGRHPIPDKHGVCEYCRARRAARDRFCVPVVRMPSLCAGLDNHRYRSLGDAHVPSGPQRSRSEGEAPRTSGCHCGRQKRTDFKRLVRFAHRGQWGRLHSVERCLKLSPWKFWVTDY
jgi:hypothetical protein